MSLTLPSYRSGNITSLRFHSPILLRVSPVENSTLRKSAQPERHLPALMPPSRQRSR
jgi:hypothetical protein